MAGAESEMARAMARDPAARSPLDVAWAYRTMGQVLAYKGEMAASVEQFEKAYAIVHEADGLPRKFRASFHLAYNSFT